VTSLPQRRTAGDPDAAWREFLSGRAELRDRERAAAQARASGRRRRESAMEFLAGHRRPDLVRRYKDLRLVEYHEAGHVVAAWALGYDVLRASVDRAGHCGETGLAARVAAPWDMMAILWSGMAAETQHPKWNGELSELWSDCEDSDRFARMAGEYEPIAGKVASGRAARIVELYRPVIARVADAFGWSGELGPAELEKLRATAGDLR
jgi:hypothetical protein